MKAVSSSMVEHRRPQWRLRPLALSLACMGAAPAFAQTLPTGFNAIAGTVSRTQSGGVMTINQDSQRAIAQWQSFSIGAGGVVNVQQPNASSVLLNRVVGGEASVIAGRLTANGHVFLVNPAGVTFANGSSVSVGGLVASTLAITDSNFIGGGVDTPIGKGSTFAFAATDAASVARVHVAQGASITADPGGVVALVGGVVRNDGNINVARGSAGLVSGSQVTVDFDGDGLTTFKIPTGGATTFGIADAKAADASTTAQLMNAGTVAADGGRVVLMGSSTVAQQVVRQSGTVQAQSLQSRNGEIVLVAGGGAGAEMQLGGSIDASGTTAGVKGGSVIAVAGKLRLEDASINASGSQGGEAQLLGVSAFSMSPQSVVRADATDANGGGGAVLVGSVAFAHVSGALSARGAGNGAGGAVSTIGAAVEVTDQAMVDASGGATGTNGTWTVSSRFDLNVTNAVPAYDAKNYSSGATAVHADALGRALGRGTDVVLSSNALASEGRSDGVGVVFASGAKVIKAEGRESTLTVNSQRNIRMEAGSAIQSKAGALNVDFNADSVGAALSEDTLIIGEFGDPNARVGSIVMTDAKIETSGGSVRFYGQGDADTGRAIGSVTITKDGMDGGVVLTRSTISTCAMSSSGCTNDGGSISLRGQGSTEFQSVNLSSTVGVDLVGATLQTGAGDISIDGRGGFGAAGVRIDRSAVDGQPVVATSMQSDSGNLWIRGSTSAATDSGGIPIGRGLVYGEGGPTGVAISHANIAMNGNSQGGNIRIEGVGADFGLTPVLSLDGKSVYAGSTGVFISDSRISAATGREISVIGKAGSRGFTGPVGDPAAVTFDPYSVEILAGPSGTALRADSGQIRIDGQGGDVRLGLTDDAGSQTVLSVANTSGPGGSIRVDGRNIVVSGNGTDAVARIDATGTGQGGNVVLRAGAVENQAGSGIVAMNSDVVIDASASTPIGNGGDIRLLGERSLYAYGNLAARSGAAGGDGGFIETSGAFAIPEPFTSNQDGFIGGGIELNGLRVDASAPAGKAGTWLIDPQDVTIQTGTATGVLPPGNPSVYTPLVSSTLQDSDISAALNAGTSVTITTGNPLSLPLTGGDIRIDDGVRILYNQAKGPVTLQLDAHRNIGFGGDVVIASHDAGGPLNLVLNANVNGASTAVGGGSVFATVGGSIYTNGGNVAMSGSDTSSTAGSSIWLEGMVIDTRAGNQQVAGAPATYTGGKDTNPGGAVQLVGRTLGDPTDFDPDDTFAGVYLSGTTISTSTGNVSVLGSSVSDSGVRIDGGRATGIFTTSGKIDVAGIGSEAVFSQIDGLGHGVDIQNATLQSGSGNITLRGLRLASTAPDAGAGVNLDAASLIATVGGGNIDIAGTSQGNGAGVYLAPLLVGPAVAPAARIDGSNNVILRTSNDNTTDALVIDGSVRAANVLNLRPGSVDAAGNAADAVNNPITLGGASVPGFSVSADEFTRLSAATVVAGSNAQVGDINVAGPLALSSALTLQNQGGGGNINLNGTLSTPQLALLAGGSVSQAAGATITAGTLLARANTGNVTLTDAANNVGTVVGTAAGSFQYIDADALTIGPVTATTFNASSNAPQTDAATSMAATNVFVRNLIGDMSLAANVSSTAGADLVTAARLQNTGGNSLGGAPWRVWADTWVGETRGGLAGSAPLPNFYNCAYGGFCGVTVTPGSHFIYRQQPDATVVVRNQSRPFGLPNQPFTYTLAGLILGDTGAGFSGVLSSPATRTSLPGRYPIDGSYTSAEGYRVTVVPGELQVTAAISRPLPEAVREMPSTWLYDRNIGQAPICLATGPLDGDRASQAGDVLAREWSRVRSRPNLLNCVDTEKRNGCADF